MSYDRNALTVGIAQRLRKLREHWKSPDGTEKKLSHEELSEKLAEQYGIRIHPDTLKFYEATERSKFGNNLGMKLETLYILADFYRVSVDAILGRDPYPLSDRARHNLSALSATPYRDVMNAFLGSGCFPNILGILCGARRKADLMLKEVLNGESITEARLGEIRYEARHLQRDTSEDIEQKLRPISGFSSVESAIRIRLKKIREETENDNYTQKAKEP